MAVSALTRPHRLLGILVGFVEGEDGPCEAYCSCGVTITGPTFDEARRQLYLHAERAQAA